MEQRSVAIDGPSGAGKSTLARKAAEALGFLYVDTGAIYRTVALYAMEQGVDPADTVGVSALLPDVDITMNYGADGLQHMYLCGRDVTQAIRRPEVSPGASKAAAIPAVRTHLLAMQRKFACDHDVVMDGRDIGTVVLPCAGVKIFLTASAQARAQRRHLELEERGTPQPFEEVLRETIARDERDSNRAIAPLRPAEDSVILDTTELDRDQSLDRILAIVREKINL